MGQHLLMPLVVNEHGVSVNYTLVKAVMDAHERNRETMAIGKRKGLREKRVIDGPKIAEGGQKPSPIFGRNKVAVPKGPPKKKG
jgi:hypothetical protein